MTLVERETLTTDEFAAALRAESKRYHDQHPFHVRMNRGALGREEIHLWAANRFYYQRCIPLKDAAIISNCPDQDVRRAWLRRVVEHDGSEARCGGIESWLALGEAVGLTREEILSERRVLPGVRFAVDAYVTFCRTRPWIEGIAASLTELFSARAIEVRLDALARHYDWIEAAGLQYFRHRLDQAPRDAQHALGLVLERCGTREQQDRAVAALQFKSEVLWAQLDAIDAPHTHELEA